MTGYRFIFNAPPYPAERAYWFDLIGSTLLIRVYWSGLIYP